MRRTRIWILVILLLAGIGLLAMAGALLVLTWGPRIPSQSVLVLDLRGEIPEEPVASFWDRIVVGDRKTVLDTSQMLREAARDERIRAVLVRVGFLAVGWGKVQELRDALLALSETGKPVIALIDFGGTREYYLASGASRIGMVPNGVLMLGGLAVHLPFAKEALDKLKIRAEIEHIGDYKTAGDLYTRDRPRAAHLEEMNALLDDLYGQLVEGIARERDLSPGQTRELVDRGLYTANQALEAGLVDLLAYDDEVLDTLGDELSEELEELKEGAYLKVVRRVQKKDARVALIYAAGTIVTGQSSDQRYGEKMLGSESLVEAVRAARDDEEIAAIVLRVNSPGGSGIASDLIWREIQVAREKKPVVVSMSDLGASGGYWISMGSDAIVAEPGTLTASIGILGGKFDLGGFFEWIGVYWELLQRGRNADMFTSVHGFSPEQRENLRETMRELYEEFVRKVAQGRGMSEEEVEAVARGRVWTGKQAKELGLVDRLGGMSVAVATAREKAGLPPSETLSVKILPHPPGFLESLRTGEFRDPALQVPRPLREITSQVELSERLGHEMVLFLPPYNPDIR